MNYMVLEYRNDRNKYFDVSIGDFYDAERWIIKMKLSIIIPVYNAEKYICALLAPILSTDYDLEVICVDDGSTDNSVSVIKEYKDGRVKVFSKRNEGAYKAWQYGLRQSRGDYIVILDSDDYIDDDYVDIIMDFINTIHADILFTSYFIEKENGEKTVCEIGLDDGLYEDEKLNLIKCKLLGARVPYSKATKVVRRELYIRMLNSTYKGKLKDYEDWLTMVNIFSMAKSVFVDNRAYYHYVQHSNSVSKSTVSYNDNYNSFLKVLNFMENELRSKIGIDNYNSFCFRGLYFLLGRSVAISEYDLVYKIINNNLFHDNILSSDLSKKEKIIYFFKCIWLVKLHKFLKKKINISE